MKNPLTDHRKKADSDFTNLTGKQLLDRGCIREQELINLGYVWNRDDYSYIKSVGKRSSKAIRQINLLAYNDAEWLAIDK